jgi:hypothetical protein
MTQFWPSLLAADDRPQVARESASNRPRTVQSAVRREWELDTDDTKSAACDIGKIQPLAILFALGSVSTSERHHDDRNAATFHPTLERTDRAEEEALL